MTIVTIGHRTFILCLPPTRSRHQSFNPIRSTLIILSLIFQMSHHLAPLSQTSNHNKTQHNLDAFDQCAMSPLWMKTELPTLMHHYLLATYLFCARYHRSFRTRIRRTPRSSGEEKYCQTAKFDGTTTLVSQRRAVLVRLPQSARAPMPNHPFSLHQNALRWVIRFQ